ncbi:extensin-like [Helianthus annuus]|uniref:extensin-like n=1 Tax=Helianthus annuus TaxID=4232 RepID=UPI000B8F5321|nr:extensin-like [Helianthus annuus]
MDVDDDPDPAMPPSGTPTHPIEISSSSSFAGSPYIGPDIWAERWSTYKWEFTPPHHNSPPPQRAPSEEPLFQAVTPPPPPAPEQPPPPEPSRRRRSARMSVRGGFHFSTPQNSSNYLPIFEDPQMGGPSNAVLEVDSAPVTPAPPPMGYESPIRAYQDTTGYNPFEPQAYSGYNYSAPAVDPYVEAANFNALYPSPFPPAYPTGYPAYGYQYPPPPQP